MFDHNDMDILEDATREYAEDGVVAVDTMMATGLHPDDVLHHTHRHMHDAEERLHSEQA